MCSFPDNSLRTALISSFRVIILNRWFEASERWLYWLGDRSNTSWKVGELLHAGTDGSKGRGPWQPVRTYTGVFCWGPFNSWGALRLPTTLTVLETLIFYQMCTSPWSFPLPQSIPARLRSRRLTVQEMDGRAMAQGCFSRWAGPLPALGLLELIPEH